LLKFKSGDYLVILANTLDRPLLAVQRPWGDGAIRPLPVVQVSRKL